MIQTSQPPGIDDLLAVTAPVEQRLAQFFALERSRWQEVDPALVDVVDDLATFVLAGGKRLRPALVHWGYVASDGDGAGPTPPTVISVAAAMEVLHAFALLHDDVMDGATTRRGRPAFHELQRTRHRLGGWRGEARRFGEGMAVLAGDLAFVYADQLLAPAAAEPERGERLRQVWDELRVEVTMGQHLDVLGAAQGHRDEGRAALVAQIKSGRYSVERPLQLGAALAGRLDELGPVLTAYGRPLGAAFQYRDDLLGAVGDPHATGKPVGDDLREGKPTLLVALAHRLADDRQRAELAALGDPGLDDGAIARLQQVLVDCGAVEQLEQIIVTLVVDAVDALDHPGLSAAGRDALGALAEQLAFRQR